MHRLPEDILGKIVSYVAEGETKEQTFPESVLHIAMELRDDYIRDMINDLPCVVEIINTINENIDMPKYYFGCDKHHVLGYDKWVQNDSLDFENFHQEFARTKDRLHSLRLYPLVENLVAQRQMNTRVITRLVHDGETGYEIGVMWPSAAVSVAFEESVDYDHPTSWISLSRGIRWRKFIPGGCLVVYCTRDSPDADGIYMLVVRCTSSKSDVTDAELLSKYGDVLISFIEMVLLLNTGGNPEWFIQATRGIKALIKQNAVRLWKYGINSTATSME
ncbi:hypothetical protein M9434_003494 [Picochlorum sp. BPE23]|nr:hypothetical protein M9434_003494 [Picochlorum sp. BPE23]